MVPNCPRPLLSRQVKNLCAWGATARIVDALFRQNSAPFWAKIHPGLKRREREPRCNSSMHFVCLSDLGVAISCMHPNRCNRELPPNQ